MQQPLVDEAGKAGVRFQARSQDIGPAVLVRVFRRQLPARTNFSAKEKDEASPSAGAWRDSSNAFILRFAGVWRFFYFPAPRWSLNR